MLAQRLSGILLVTRSNFLIILCIAHTTQDGCMDTSAPLTTAVPGQPQPPPTQGVTHLPSGVPKCAISECPNPCFVDESGTVHECCGVTHAMEHQRRQALWQRMC